MKTFLKAGKAPIYTLSCLDLEFYNAHQSIASLQMLKAIRKFCLIVSGWTVQSAVGEYSKLSEELSHLINF